MEGVPGHRPLNKGEPKPSREKRPAAPAWLTPGAREVWDDLAPKIHPIGLLTEADWATFAAYCAAVDTLATCSVLLQDAQGKLELTTPELYHITNHETGEMEVREGPDRVKAMTVQFFKALDSVNRLSAAFGLSPSSRSRIQVPPHDPDDPRGGIR